MRFRLCLTVVAGLLVAAPMTMGTQTMSRTATTLAAITRYPAFYHDKVVALVGTPVEIVYRLHGWDEELGAVTYPDLYAHGKETHS